jgi:glycosyltransferase involved in cell wall biosynthesis
MRDIRGNIMLNSINAMDIGEPYKRGKVMKKVHRVTIVTPFYPPDLGGIAVHVHELVNRLMSFGIKCQVITCARNPRSLYWVKRIGDGLEVVGVNSVTPISFPETMKSFRIPFYGMFTRDIICSFDPDIIHLHGHHYPINWLAAFDQKLRDIPKVLTVHGMYALNPYNVGGKTIIEEIFNQTLLRSFLSKIDGVIALTRTIAKYISRYTHKPIFIIPNGVNVSVFQENLHRKMEYRRNYDLPEDKKIILFRGRFNHVKGIIEYSEAAAILSRLRDDIYFLAVGDGPLKPTVIKIFEKYVNGRVMSWMPYDRIHELYIASDIYVLPSKWEALPITLLESMAAGLTIVATSIGGIPDLLNQYPKKVLIYPPATRFILPGIIDALKMIDKNFNEEYQSILKRYSWESVINKILQAYSRML